GEDAIPGWERDLVNLEGEDRVGETAVGQAAGVEVISKGAKAQEAVRAGIGCCVGVTVNRDREWENDSRGAVIGMVADVRCACDNGAARIGDAVGSTAR